MCAFPVEDAKAAKDAKAATGNLGWASGFQDPTCQPQIPWRSWRSLAALASSTGESVEGVERGREVVPVAQVAAEGLDSRHEKRTRVSGTRPRRTTQGPMNCARPLSFVFSVTVLSLSSGGCGGSKEASAKVPTADQLPLAIEHESCDVTSGSAEKLDTNGDG